MAEMRNGKITSSCIGDNMIQRNEQGEIVCIQHSWHKNDIECRVNDMELGPLPEHMYDDILMSLDSRFDASTGINWDVIDTHIIMAIESNNKK